jgi:hypothetical protein
MRAIYFKHRHWTNLSKDTNDIGRPLFWPKNREDNHFLYRLYDKPEDKFSIFYKYHLDNFLKLYPDAEEKEFFKHVWDIVDDTIGELKVKDRYTSRHPMEFRNKQHLKSFLEYLKTIDQWDTGLTKDEIIADKEGEIRSLKEQLVELKEELKAARKLETEDFINIQDGQLLSFLDLCLKIQRLLIDGKELVFSQTQTVWVKMICKHFRHGNKEIKFDTIRRYFPGNPNEPSRRSAPIPAKSQHFQIVQAKKRS